MRSNLTLFVLSAAASLGAKACLADGQGVLVQAIDDRLVVGAGDDSPGGQQIGQSVFGQLLPPSGIDRDPSFFSLSPPPRDWTPCRSARPPTGTFCRSPSTA